MSKQEDFNMEDFAEAIFRPIGHQENENDGIKKEVLKLTKVVNEIDLNAKEFAHAVADVVDELYGTHNFEDFKKIINQKLKTD